jgi:hypothetical protein
MRKYILFAAVLAVVTAGPLAAQDKSSAPERKTEYKNGIGIRVGSTSGIDFKHFMNSTHAMEFILGIWPNAVGFTGLYEVHAATGVDGFKFYYGGGAHLTVGSNRGYFVTNRTRDREYVYRYGRNGIGIGVDGVVGLDYKIPVIPFSISVDLKPYLEVTNYGNVNVALDPGLGLRVAF